MEPSLELNEPPPVALELTVVVVPYPGAPAPSPKPQDSDCEIMDDPAVVAYKPKKDWAKKRMQQTKKTLVLHLPRCDVPAPKKGKEAAAAAQNEAPPPHKMEQILELKRKKAETQAVSQWMSKTRNPPPVDIG